SSSQKCRMAVFTPATSSSTRIGTTCAAIHVSANSWLKRPNHWSKLTTMAAENAGQAELEIGHVLFIDIVGYSKLLTSEQREHLEHLNQIVRGTEPFRVADAAGKLLRLPTGDGMVLVFSTSPDAPARCAIAIARDSGPNSNLPLRMGIHSGPVDRISHV